MVMSTRRFWVTSFQRRHAYEGKGMNGVLLWEGRQVECGRGWVKKPGHVVVTMMMAA